MKTKWKVLGVLLSVCMMMTGLAVGQVPQLINYQGVLVDPATGQPVPDAAYSITFSIYDVVSGGSAIWTELQSVQTKNGLYSVTLGSTTTLRPDILSGTEKYLGIKVGSDPEMTPRKRIVSVAYAILSGDADKLDGKQATEFANAIHNHDDRYFTETELNTSDGTPPNQGSNRMSWNNLHDMPEGFADGVDNVGTGGDNDWTISGDDMYSAVSGNVGIGLNVPDRKLHIGNGLIRIDRDENSVGILLHRYNASLPLKTFLLGVNASGEDVGYFFVGDNHTAVSGAPDMRLVIGNDGDVGIGTADPGAKLHVRGSESTDAILLLEPGEWNSAGDYGKICFGDTFHTIKGEHSVGMTFYDFNKFQFIGGNVGIGTTSPSNETQLHIQTTTDNFGVLVDAVGTSGSEIGLVSSQSKYADLAKNAYYTPGNWQRFDETSGAFLQEILPGGDVRFRVVGAGANPISWTEALVLRTSGIVECPVLKLTGGSDIAEPFDIKETDVIKAGMVLTIDPENPGNLKISQKAYDRRVAGIISGAGGIEPGMLMGQSGSVTDGEYPVALTGRVYCWADASNGPIQPGDLLTTSDTPGHAMKVTDYTRAQGAILGKAMSSLEEGQGLVLVLVTLQ